LSARRSSDHAGRCQPGTSARPIRPLRCCCFLSAAPLRLCRCRLADKPMPYYSSQRRRFLERRRSEPEPLLYIIPEVNCYDCVDKSLIEVRRDYYDLLVSLPKYMQQIRSFCSTRLTKLQCWEETIPVWITYKRVVYTLARHKCLGYSNYRSKAIPFSRPLSLMSTELTESISSHPASCGASKQSSCSLTW